MTAIVIDIATGKKINEAADSESRVESTKSNRPLLEISAPDGRTVFSIGRLLSQPSGDDNSNSIAA